MSGNFQYERDPSINVKAIAIAVVTLAIFVAGSVSALAILRTRTRMILPGGENIPAEVRQGEVGIVIKTLYQTDTRFQQQRAQQEATLHDYGWVDRADRRIHIPIDQAIDEYLKSQPAGQHR